MEKKDYLNDFSVQIEKCNDLAQRVLMYRLYNEYLKNLQNIKFKKYAWPDEFIRHGSVEELEKIYCDFVSILQIKK